jgi:hypothetical protein
MSVNPFDVIELRLNIMDSKLDKILKAPLTKQDPPDLCGIEDAQIELGTPGHPISKAKIYQLTYLKQLNSQRRNGRLIFSRRELKAYVESHTVSSSSSEDEMNAKLIASAEKKLRADEK